MIYVNEDNTTREATAEEVAEAEALFDQASSCRMMIANKAGWEALRAINLPLRNTLCNAWILFEQMCLDGQGQAVYDTIQSMDLPTELEEYRQPLLDSIYIPT